MKFEEDYFKNSVLSNYKDYTKKNYDSLTDDLINHFKFKKTDIILDFGCATGQLLYSLYQKGYENIRGTDVSYWAIEYGKKNFSIEKKLSYFNINMLVEPKDYVLFLDVLEHIPTGELKKILSLCNSTSFKAVIMRVPICKKEGGLFVLKVSQSDKTHIQCRTREWWIKTFEDAGYKLKEDLHLNSIYSSEGVFAGVFVFNKERNGVSV